MLNCRFCKRTPEESSTESLPIDVQNSLNSDFKYFSCDCRLEWFEVDECKELFNLKLFGKEIRTFKDCKVLMEDLNNDFSYYNAVSAIKDCLVRINDWLISSEDIDKAINDYYIKNQLNVILKINECYYRA